MKNIILLLFVWLILGGCQKKFYQTYPECADYYKFIKESWHKKDNGFFLVKEVRDTTEPVWIHFEKGPRFQRQWDKYVDNCLCQLSEKEVKQLFGKPTRITSTYKVVKKVTTKTYGYHIADGICNEQEQKKTDVNICSFIGFTFWKGKQDRRYTSHPRLHLYYNYD